MLHNFRTFSSVSSKEVKLPFQIKNVHEEVRRWHENTITRKNLESVLISF